MLFSACSITALRAVIEHALIKAHPDDDLPKEFDSYLNYLDRVADLYSFLKKPAAI